ncbi:MAG: tail fiber protein [Spirochaetota bacterium]
MADAYIGEIRAFAFNFVPQGWYACNGQTLQIQLNQALYAVIGTTYGGDGQKTFMVPNLNPPITGARIGLAMVGTGTGASGTPYMLGKTTGVPSVALSNAQLPTHSHSVNAINLLSPALPVAVATNTTYLSRLVTPANENELAYTTDATKPINTSLNAATIVPYGTAGSHDNYQPCLALNFCINNDGMYPAPAQ